jgi:hypothetical protein
MPAEIKFANGESLRVDEDPRQVLKAIQEADEIGPLMIASVNGTHQVYLNVDQIRSVSKP